MDSNVLTKIKNLVAKLKNIDQNTKITFGKLGTTENSNVKDLVTILTYIQTAALETQPPKGETNAVNQAFEKEKREFLDTIRKILNKNINLFGNIEKYFSEQVKGRIVGKKTMMNYLNEKLKSNLLKYTIQPEIIVIVNNFGPGQVSPDVQNTIKEQLNNLAGADNITFTNLRDDGEKSKIVSEINNKVTQLIEGRKYSMLMLGASGSGKTTFVNTVKNKLGFLRNKGVVIHPTINISGGGRDKPSFVTYKDEIKRDMPYENFKDTYVRPTPFNNESSRAHFLYKNGKNVIADLCGTESAEEISQNSELLNRQNIFSIESAEIMKNFKTHYNNIKEEEKDSIKKRIKEYFGVNDDIQAAGKYKSLDNFQKLYFFTSGYKNPERGDDLKKKGDDLEKKGEMIKRCFESFWIMRTLDELSGLYNSTQGYVTNAGTIKWKTSDNFKIPDGTKYEIGDMYKMPIRFYKQTNIVNTSKPFSLGQENTSTPTSNLLRTIEPNTTMLTTPRNVNINSRRKHILVVMLKLGGDETELNEVQMSTVNRVSKFKA
jgi:hypothetical protein